MDITTECSMCFSLLSENGINNEEQGASRRSGAASWLRRKLARSAAVKGALLMGECDVADSGHSKKRPVKKRNPDTVVTLIPCLHQLHLGCIEQWLPGHIKCPVQDCGGVVRQTVPVLSNPVDLKKELLSVILRHDLNGVRQILDSGITPIGTDEKNTAPLSMAIKEQQWDIVEALVKHGFTVTNAEEKSTIALMFHQGSRVAQDHGAAAKWFTLAADQGYDQAQVNLARMYLNGDSVERNESKAAELYKHAARQGNDTAQFELGCLFINGIGVERHVDAAVNWFTAAARQGNKEAQNQLAAMRRDGYRVP